MKKFKQFFLALVMSMTVSNSSYSIQHSTALLLGCASGVGAGAVTYACSDKNILASGLVGAGTMAIVYLIARECTPERRFERAKNLLNCAENNLFVCVSYKEDAEFFDAMNTAYATDDLPYAVAYYDLTRRLACLNSARVLFECVLSEGNSMLQDLSGKYVGYINEIAHNIIDGIKRIKRAKEFTKQLKIYEKRRLTEKRLAIEERKAAARESQARAEHNQALAQHNSAWAQHRQANAQYAQAYRAAW